MPRTFHVLPNLSDSADKTASLMDLTISAPGEWPVERKREYVEWCTKVVAGLRGINAPLESIFDSVVGEKLKLFAQHKNAAAPTLSQLEIS